MVQQTSMNRHRKAELEKVLKPDILMRRLHCYLEVDAARRGWSLFNFPWGTGEFPRPFRNITAQWNHPESIETAS